MRSERVRSCAIALVVTLGCGGGSAPAAVEPSANHEPPTAAPALVIGPVSWELGQPLRVDARGTVFGGTSVMGTLTPTGDFVLDDGSIGARIAPDGSVEVDGHVSRFRVVDATVVETSAASDPSPQPPVMRLDGSELVFDMDSRGERIPIADFRPELTREVLFLSTMMLVGMTSGH